MSIETRFHQYGKVFDHWQIKEILGTGSGGKTAVFRLGRSDSSRGDSALKVVNLIEEQGDFYALPESRRREYEAAREACSRNAEREVWLMDELRGNTNIVDYLDHTFVDWSDKSGFGRDLLIRMELLKDLRKEMKSGKIFSEAEVRKVGHDICNALVLCHKKNILHRDIKPENIFQNRDGSYKLGDFGVSRVLDASPGASADTGIGTFEYWPAEQSSGQYDKRVDIYSLGLVLYELSNGNRLPFAGSSYVTNAEVTKRLSGNPLPKPSNASPELSSVILKACAFKPEDRYQSAAEFLEDIDRLDEGELELEDITPEEPGGYQTRYAKADGPKDPPENPPEDPPEKPKRPRWLIAAIAGIAALCIVIGMAVIFGGGKQSDKDVSDKDVAANAPEETTSGAHTGTGSTEDPADAAYRNAVAHCEELKAKGAYGEAVDYLEECVSNNSQDSRYADLLAQYQELLKRSILEAADEYASSKQYRLAIHTLDEAWKQYGYQEFFEYAMVYRLDFGTYNSAYFSAGKYNTMLIRENHVAQVVGDDSNGELDANGWSNIIAVGAGDRHVVGLKADGTVVAEGENQYKQCAVEDWYDIVAISAGDVHTVGLTVRGAVVATGYNAQKQCQVDKLMQTAGERMIVSVAAGYHHTLALLDDGTVLACGSDSVYKGCCNVYGWSDIASIYAGTSFSAGLKTDGTVVADGVNRTGESIGDVWDFSGWTDMINLAAGDYFLVGLKSDGTVLFTGSGSEIGIDAVNEISSWQNIVQISAGHDHVIALTANGQLLCAGNDGYGQCDLYGAKITYPAN